MAGAAHSLMPGRIPCHIYLCAGGATNQKFNQKLHIPTSGSRPPEVGANSNENNNGGPSGRAWSPFSYPTQHHLNYLLFVYWPPNHAGGQYQDQQKKQNKEQKL